MPLFIWLSACSYWHRVTAEMTRATLQFLDQVEYPPFREAKRSDFGQTDRFNLPGHEDVLARVTKSRA